MFRQTVMKLLRLGVHNLTQRRDGRVSFRFQTLTVSVTVFSCERDLCRLDSNNNFIVYSRRNGIVPKILHQLIRSHEPIHSSLS